MGELDALGFAGKHDGVIAGDIAAAQRGKTDSAPAPGAGHAVAAALGHLLERHPPAGGGGAAERQGRARWRVHLVAVMHFQDFDVVAGIERAGRLFDQVQQQGHAHAHIGRPKDRRLLRRLAQDRHLLGAHAAGPGHQRRAVLGREPGMGHGRLGTGEVGDHRGGGEDRCGIAGDGHAERLQARQTAGILPQLLRSWPLAGCDQPAPWGRRNLPDDHLAHAASRADHSNLQFAQPRPP